MHYRVLAALAILIAFVPARPAAAQVTDIGPFSSCKIGNMIRASVETVYAEGAPDKPIGKLLRGSPLNPVSIECDDTRLFADEVEWREAEEMAYARGNVVFMQSDLNVAAERAEFNRKTRFGTFYNAVGTARLTDRPVDRSLFGTLEPEVAFHAERLAKIGPRTYTLTNGGFSTCAQPAPRWAMQGSSGTIVLDKRALLKNAVLSVKNVPIFYVPVIYYPLSEDDRSTGFLLPTYSASTIRGTGLSNAFFWAIDRSQDATFYHDWYSKAGQGYGGEYRFVAAPGSDGQGRLYILEEKDHVNDAGEVTRAAHRTYDIRGFGGMNMPHGFRLSGRTEYITDITTRQLYQQNVYDASKRDRYFGVTLTGNIKRYRLFANVERRDAFLQELRTDPATQLPVVVLNGRRQGRAPQVTVSAAEKPIGRSRLYFGVGGEVANLIQQDNVDDPTTNRGLWRFDTAPTFRFPLSKLPYLSATTSASYRLTHWLESIDPITHVQTNTPLTRQLLDLRMNVVGPVFSRIFTPGENGYAERFKHLIEPSASVRWLSPFDQINSVVKFDQVDYEVGGTTTLNYGLANRLLAKRKREGRPGDVRTILTVALSQSYYTNSQAAQYDLNYQSGSASKFSNLAFDVNGAPTDHFTARFHTEFHPDLKRPLLYSLSGTYDTRKAQFTAGWRKRSVIPGLPGYEANAATHYMNANTSLKLLDNRVGGTYGFDYDLRNNAFLQQRWIAYYNAQCCGISVDYQRFAIGAVGQPNAVQDRRFGISFTLAGIGSFANPFGTFGDNSGRR
jgi:LPS-assembly protein